MEFNNLINAGNVRKGNQGEKLISTFYRPCRSCKHSFSHAVWFWLLILFIQSLVDELYVSSSSIVDSTSTSSSTVSHVTRTSVIFVWMIVRLLTIIVKGIAWKAQIVSSKSLFDVTENQVNPCFRLPKSNLLSRILRICFLLPSLSLVSSTRLTHAIFESELCAESSSSVPFRHPPGPLFLLTSFEIVSDKRQSQRERENASRDISVVFWRLQQHQHRLSCEKNKEMVAWMICEAKDWVQESVSYRNKKFDWLWTGKE